ncbi:hypothetical protein BDZ91DRAFT_722536 [Kalaharituber pfeilii]|nr:hypothetical protein BDZ91DRAFT_722536 [Kalaharituber pfeilii]
MENQVAKIGFYKVWACLRRIIFKFKILRYSLIHFFLVSWISPPPTPSIPHLLFANIRSTEIAVDFSI